MLVDYELRWSLRLSLLSFTDLSLRRCSDIPDRISNSHICVQRTSWENTSLEASLLFFPTLITWGHLWKPRCFQRPCTSYLRFQKGHFCEYCQAFSLGFLNNNKLGKSQLLIMPCRLQDNHKDMSNIRKIPKKKCLISHSDWFHFQSDCGKLNLLADNKSQLYLQQTKVNDLLFLNKT